MRCARLLGVLGVLLLLSGKAEALPELVVNGGFETGDFTGWTLVGDEYVEDYVFVVDFNFRSGRYAAALGPMGLDGHLTQEISTTPGVEYVIELFLANLNAVQPNDNHVSVSFGGIPLYDASNLDTRDQYIRLTFTGVATGASTLLDLAFRNEPSFFYLDDVSVTVAVPEPSSLALLLVGLAGLAAVRRPKGSFGSNGAGENARSPSHHAALR